MLLKYVDGIKVANVPLSDVEKQLTKSSRQVISRWSDGFPAIRRIHSHLSGPFKTLYVCIYIYLYISSVQSSNKPCD